MMRGPRLDDRAILYTPEKPSYSISFFFLPLFSGKLTEKLENKVDMRISVELRKS